MPDSADLFDLIQSMKTDGLQVPILVRDDRVLIDGLKRIASAAYLGEKEIPAYVSSTYADSITYLTEQSKDREVNSYSSLRIWEIYEALIPQVVKRRRTRSKIGTSKVTPAEPARTMLVRALNLSSPNQVQTPVSVFISAQNNEPMAKEARDLLVAGEITCWEARRLIKESRHPIVPMNPGQRRVIIKNTVETLDALARGLRRVGPLTGEEFEPGEAEELFHIFDAARRGVGTLYRKLQAARKSEETIA